MSKYDSIIFDLDGTLWDSTETILEVWDMVLKNNSDIKKTISLTDIKSCMGLVAEDIGKKLFPDEEFSKETRNRLMQECTDLEDEYLKKAGGKIYPNLIETLEYLRENHELFIVSNCQDGYIQTFLDLNNAGDLIKDFECPGRTGLPKSENIKLIIERNNLKNAIYVGDTAKDFDACQVAKIPFIFAEYGFGEVPNFEHKISSLSELKNIF